MTGSGPTRSWPARGISRQVGESLAPGVRVIAPAANVPMPQRELPPKICETRPDPVGREERTP